MTQLDQLVSHFASGNKAEFARMLGISRQHLNIWYSREYFDIKKVFRACPGVSAEWLITGEGEMLTEKRPLNLLSQDAMIPFINTQDVLDGSWSNPWHFVVVRGYEFFYNFITRMPGGDLRYFIPHGSIFGCKVVKPDELKQKCLNIVRTMDKGTFFVQYLGEEISEGASAHKFTTRRGNQCSEMQFTIPPEDIVQCAEIKDYTINHSLENVK